MSAGIILTKLVLSGEQKADAILPLIEGVNIIVGASDTGKSFAFECINYALGSSTKLNIPPEAKGYNKIYLEITDKSTNTVFTICRNIAEDTNHIYYYYSDYENKTNTKYDILSTTASAKKNISQRLLNLLACKYEHILKSKRSGATQSFTFRSFIPLTMLSEERITCKHSPIHRTNPKGSTYATSELTSFKTIISGHDDKEQSTITLEINKSKIEGKIEELYHICEELQLESCKLKEQLSKIDIESLDKEIEDLKTILDKKTEAVTEKEVLNQSLKLKLDEYMDLYSNNESNIHKFNLLKENYLSDMERLVFISKTHSVSQQLLDVQCPLCHSDIKITDENFSNDFVKAIEAERIKIQYLLSELEITIKDEIDEEKLLKEKIESIHEQQQQNSDELSNILIPAVESCLVQIKSLMEKKNTFDQLTYNSDMIAKYNERISKLEDQLHNIPPNKVSIEILSSNSLYLKSLCTEIQSLLESWGFTTTDVTFDLKSNDVVVNNKEKATYGKGARAIINSAFLLAIMKHCQKYGLSHPNVIILDTPLTTYREKDKLKGESDESVSTGIKTSVYQYLVDNIIKSQVIIFENEEPNESIKQKINYIHFSGNKYIGRKGFIPE